MWRTHLEYFIIILLKESIFVLYYCFLLEGSNTIPCLVTEYALHWQAMSQWTEADSQSFRPSYLYTSTIIIGQWETMKELASFPLPLSTFTVYFNLSLLPYWPSVQQTVRMKTGHQIKAELFGGSILILASTAVL